MKRWLWKNAPGVKSSEGCPKKVMPYTPSLSKLYVHTLVLMKTLSYFLVNLAFMHVTVTVHTILLPSVRLLDRFFLIFY